MSTNWEQEWSTATINIQGHWNTLALRHQPLLHGDPVDPNYNWRTIEFQPTSHLPTNKQTTIEYKPLTQLAQGEPVPDGQPPKDLKNFLTDEFFSQEPENDCRKIIQNRPRNILQWVENPRVNQMERVAAALGSPTRHLISQGTPIENI